MQQAENRLLSHKYEITSKIKQGGFGIVYYGFDRIFDKPIAIKAVEPSLLQDETYVDLFLAEAKNAAKLSHNNIVHIYDLVKDENGAYFIIMEFIEGYDLGRILRQCQKRQVTLPIDFCVYIIKEVCKALEYAHNKRNPLTNQPLKLVHQDISPSNVMISLTGQVKLIDFGLAKLRHQRTASGQIIISGKIPYLAPEQVNGGKVDRRTDVFSLGVIFYELLVGSRLVAASDVNEAIQQIAKQKPDVNLLTEKKIPPEIQHVLLKMLQKNPENRYVGANGVYLDLVEYLMAHAYSVELADELGQYLQELFQIDMKNNDKAETLVSEAEVIRNDLIVPSSEIVVNEKANADSQQKKADLTADINSDVPDNINSLDNIPQDNTSPQNQTHEMDKILSEIAQHYKAAAGASPEVLRQPISSRQANAHQESQAAFLNKQVTAQIPKTLSEEEELHDELKTVFDVIRLSTKSRLQNFKRVGLVLFFIVALFLVSDFYWHFTFLGLSLHNYFLPLAIKIDSVPESAAVYLNEKRIPGETPVSLPKIAPGVYQLSLTHEGFPTITKSIQVPARGKMQIAGEGKAAEPPTIVFRFKSRIELNSAPVGADIFLNGIRFPEKTPTNFEWEEGLPLSIELAHAGFNRISGLSLHSSVGKIEIKDNEVWSNLSDSGAVSSFRFAGKFNKTFALKIIPDKVEWYLDGATTPSGNTGESQELTLSLGEHEILFTKAGFHDKRISFETSENTPETISLVLDRTVSFIARQPAGENFNNLETQLVCYIFHNKTFPIGKVTPCQVILPAVDIAVKVEKAGYHAKELIVPANQNEVVFSMDILEIPIEIFVVDALTDLPITDAAITYRSADQHEPETTFGATDDQGKCIRSLISGDYHFTAAKSGYFEKKLAFNTETDGNKLTFKLIIQ